VIRYLAWRLVAALPVVVGVTFLVFTIMSLVPGDPIDIMFHGQPPPSAETRAAMRHELGLDRPFAARYGLFLWRAVHGDLGRSLVSRRPVAEEIASRLPNTVKLTAASLAVAIVFGGLAGVLSATRRGSWLDTASMLGAVGALALPSFWLGLMLIFLFSVRLRWLPATGAGGLTHLVLPALTLGALGGAIIARMTRASLLEVLNQPYVVTARAKGLPAWRVTTGHALRNALIPLVTIVGLQAGALLSGAFIVENVFAYPGMGQLAIQGISNRDAPIAQGTVLVTAIIYLVVNFLTDVAYVAIDPRVRY
jgi:ABC-type dipeptide/oligopeptide/nickel transport system permease component